MLEPWTPRYFYMVNDLEEQIQEIKKQAEEELKSATSLKLLEEVRIKYIGKKGVITEFLQKMPTFAPELRPRAGKLLNDIKIYIEDECKRKITIIKEIERKRAFEEEKIDLTLSGRKISYGKIHPISRVFNEIIEIFLGLGFQIAEGPEVETDYYNFEALNIPKDHPARDMQDTFYVSEEILLRTHTSPVQIRTMEKFKPPIKIIAPGKVFRRDADIRHSPMFHQVEGFMVDKCISMGDLKGILELFARQIFGEDTKIRFRPSFFPFTEPSAEVDIQCVICHGEGCRVCSRTGWLEILGSGMIHPQVLRNVGYNPEEVTGFAFGMGVERIAMLKYSIDNIRLFYENDMRFIQQF